MGKGRRRAAAGAALACAAWIAFCGFQWGWGPFAALHDLKTAGLAGNASAYSLEQVEEDEESPLQGKRIVFLGSSVTYGAAAGGTSFVDFLAARDGVVAIKEAVSGTTLADDASDSYLSRLRRLDSGLKPDLVVCQLSTNDASQGKELGEVSGSYEIGDFDTHTVAGAIEYVIAYVRDVWGCPVMFYTSPRYGSERYQQMVDSLLRVQDKWGIQLIDMWDDASFNDISDEQRSLYMADDIHPTKAGYLEWWLPYFEEGLEEVLGEQGMGDA
jgi:lysophospholipase L1-like esterase